MIDDRYFGEYARFSTENKESAAVLLGADCIVGDPFSIDLRPFMGTTRAWIQNPFGADVGYLDPQTSYKLDVLATRGWSINVIFSLVAFTDSTHGGSYWGEVALICFEPSLSADFDPFISNIAKLISKGIRPKIDFGAQGVRSITESHGSWEPTQRVQFPKTDQNTAILKKSCSMMDSLVKEGRKGNKGCYLVSWAFLLAVIAAAAFSLKSCGVF